MRPVVVENEGKTKFLYRSRRHWEIACCIDDIVVEFGTSGMHFLG
jgi:hypothetical protein